jgi:hypothetical protein
MSSSWETVSVQAREKCQFSKRFAAWVLNSGF